jgi:O-antigen/teichoic acid export membrane protein
MVVVAFGLNYLLLFIFNYCSLRKVFYSQYDVNIFRKKNFEEINILWKFSLPAILAGLMVSPVVWLCNYFLVNQPGGYVEMAEFDIANQWRNTLLFIPAALSQIALPLLTSALNDNKNYKKIFNLNIKINFYLGFIMTVTFVALSPFIIDFYGENYKRAIYPLIIMFTTTFLITVNNVIGQAIASQGKMWYGFYVNTIWAIVLIICSYILIVKYQLGAIGLSLAFLISYIIHTPIQFLLIREKL